MLTLENFEKLSLSPIAKKPIAMNVVGDDGEKTEIWLAGVNRLGKHEQYKQIKLVLTKLIVADISDETRIQILEQMMVPIDRLILQMQGEYVNNPQNSIDEQKQYVNEVRSLCYLMILVYQGVAFRTHALLDKEANQTLLSKKWLQKIKQTGFADNLGLTDRNKRMYVFSVYQIMATCYRLLTEFALTYQQTPSCIWGILNRWYLNTLSMHLENLCISRISQWPPNCIHQQYIQCFLANFVNLFAYRRPDILLIFKILPDWVNYTSVTFTPESNLKIFVNLQRATPPELITPYASVNPYNGDYVCLFLDVRRLLEHLDALEEQAKVDRSLLFESRLAKMILAAVKYQSQNIESTRISNQKAQMVASFGGIFKELSEGKSFNQIIAQSKLKSEYHPKIVIEPDENSHREIVTLVRKSDSGAKFCIGDFANTEEGENRILNRPYLPVFALFAMKSIKSTNKNPWRLGIVHCAMANEKTVQVDGRFLGRILLTCGVRLATRDMRPHDFTQALLVAGDDLNPQATLILPKYHFKEYDTIVLRVDVKETILRLEKQLLSTDEIEQYQIVRLMD